MSTRTKPTGSPSCPHLRWGVQGGGRGKGSADAANPLQVGITADAPCNFPPKLPVTPGNRVPVFCR